MFFRKQRAALASFHPAHRQLIEQRTLSVTLRASDWQHVLASLSRQQTEIRRPKWGLPPRVRLVLVPLLRVLLADMRPDAHLGLTVDLRGPKAPGKEGAMVELQARRPVLKLQQWFSLDAWLSVRAELRDGSVLDLALADRVRYRRVKKRSSSGKTKFKTKTKTVQLLRVTRRLPKGAALRRPGGPPPRWVAVRVKDGARPVVRASAKLPEAPDDAALANVVLDLSTEVFRWAPPHTMRRAA
ncbi:hypothetical protein [Actinomadura flavalba]|uniref:hypothetical protein n=1 Tax=Actinomadura flavalba TaxID=1120938 RepID=UPI00039D21BC|nr:hypothetical protein [Actinomadura flavalba]